jgi:hypothetical protein
MLRASCGLTRRDYGQSARRQSRAARGSGILLAGPRVGRHSDAWKRLAEDRYEFAGPRLVELERLAHRAGILSLGRTVGVDLDHTFTRPLREPPTSRARAVLARSPAGGRGVELCDVGHRDCLPAILVTQARVRPPVAVFLVLPTQAAPFGSHAVLARPDRGSRSWLSAFVKQPTTSPRGTLTAPRKRKRAVHGPHG